MSYKDEQESSYFSIVNPVIENKKTLTPVYL